MSTFLNSAFLLLLSASIAFACLVTNCPKGGKRSKYGPAEGAIKPCITCGPGQSGQCFGPNICCGPFGCLLGTPETLRCQLEGLFNEPEPCVAGGAPCRGHTGRCAFDGICCDQESCHVDKGCAGGQKLRGFPEAPVDLYSLVSYYR